VTSLMKVLATSLLLTSLCVASNVQDHFVGVQRTTVHCFFPLTMQRIQGSGICINPGCSVIATAYHVQMMTGKAKLGVIGGHTTKVLSLANERDTNKTDVPAGKGSLFYNIANDVSFIYTSKPVSNKSGTPYSYRSYVGQNVIVAGYRDGNFETKSARIIGLNVALVVGQAQLNENLILDIDLKPGCSGSAVLDQSGNLLGMVTLAGVLKFESGDLNASVALPIRTIANALVKLDPSLGAAIFDHIPDEEPKPLESSSVVYQEEDDVPENTSPVIPMLTVVPGEVPNSVDKLRTRSEAASKVMVNLITNQCLVQGTQKPLCYELSMADGQQVFRKIYASGKLGKRTGFLPVQKHGVWMQSDWTDALGEVADHPWVFQGSVDGRYLFTFKSSADDDRCYYEEYSHGIPLFGGGHPEWKGSVGCFEQVLTDKDFNVMVVYSEMYPPGDCLTQLVQTAIYYDWIKLEGLKSPVLLPVKERITAKVMGQKELSYANASWTDYKQFRTDHKVKF
jgi:hypothetical protein